MFSAQLSRHLEHDARRRAAVISAYKVIQPFRVVVGCQQNDSLSLTGNLHHDIFHRQASRRSVRRKRIGIHGATRARQLRCNVVLHLQDRLRTRWPRSKAHLLRHVPVGQLAIKPTCTFRGKAVVRNLGLCGQVRRNCGAGRSICVIVRSTCLAARDEARDTQQKRCAAAHTRAPQVRALPECFAHGFLSL